MSWPLFFTINSIECVRRGQRQGESRGACVRQKCLHVVEARRGKLPFSSTWCEHWPCGGCLSAWVCVLVCVCVKLCCLPISISFCFASFPAHKQFTQEQIQPHTHTPKHTTALRDTWQTASLRVYPPQGKHSLLELISSCCCCSLCCCAHAMSPCVDKKEKKQEMKTRKTERKLRSLCTI